MINIEIAVVFQVGETCTPSPAAGANLRFDGGILKNTVYVAVQAIAYLRQATIREKRVAGVLDTGDEPVQVAIIVVVTDGGTHAVAIDDYIDVCRV